MADIAHSLVRRAFDASQQHMNDDNNGEERPFKQITLLGMGIMWVTLVLYMAIASAISYTYGDVVATLAMIETPVTNAYIVEQESPDAKEPLIAKDGGMKERPIAKDGDVCLVKKAPVTAKLRTAARHLRSVAGPFARFRGLHIAFIYHALYNIATAFFGRLGGPLLRPFIAILVSMMLSRIHMTWTHTIISLPSSKSWWQRIPSLKMGRKVLLPTAIWATAQQLCLYVPGALFVNVYDILRNPQAYGSKPQATQKVALVQLIGVFLIFLATILLIVVPAEVSMKRVEASMLPEEDETIVPFDRSFAGKSKPEALGGTGAVSILDAWRTFGKEPRLRLIKLYVKVFAIQIALTIFFTMVVVGELKMILGGDFERLIDAARKSVKGEL